MLRGAAQWRLIALPPRASNMIDRENGEAPQLALSRC
ncbi:hypothetical protein SAMN05443247_09700 [Bradyrhizobium erythrophlei]|nr:hypothetical protein SAMN05443247_09700 [Bradyrhizobium erythrophlei]